MPVSIHVADPMWMYQPLLGWSDEVLKKVYRENAQTVLRKARANAQAGR